MRDSTWEYTIRAYRPMNQGGGLLMETGHVGTASRDMEIAAWKARASRGEVGHIEVIAHVPPYEMTRKYFALFP